MATSIITTACRLVIAGWFLAAGRLCAKCQSCDAEELHIPVVDLAENDFSILSKELAAACATTGLFRPINHGISKDVIAEAVTARDAIFNLPLTAKKSIPARSGGFTRGYLPLGAESGSTRLECKEAFSYGLDWNPDPQEANALQGPNEWPQSPDFDGHRIALAR